uniref:Uncharacterized protein n=1 Tax=viral metagenome TaxID=1070528 RepID=A0A6C0AEI0_9ZZZZ
MVLEIILIILIIIICIVFYIFRFEIFDMDFTDSFGKYSEPIQSSCISPNGKCNIPGNQYTYRECVKNPITGKGCLDENNIQTFKSQTTSTQCLPSCRSSIWGAEIISPCQKRNTLDCLISGEQGIRSIKKECLNNDASGINTCKYKLSDTGIISTGCELNGETVTCKVGSYFEKYETCENLDNFPICGNWGVLKGTIPEEHSKVNNQETFFSEFLSCDANEDQFYFSKNCRSFENGNLISGDVNIFKKGFHNVKMVCRDENGNATKCQKIECTKSLKNIYNNLNNNKKSIGCPVETINYTCHKPCVYINELEGNWDQEIKNLVGNFKIINKSDFFLTLNNIPCSYNNSLTKKQITKTKLYDCFGDPESNLHPTKCIMVNSLEVLNNKEIYSINKNCNNEKIITRSGLLVSLKPTRNYSGNPNILFCHIISIFSGEYKGVLVYEKDQLFWRKFDFLNENLKATEFLLEYTGGYFNLKVNGKVVNLETENGKKMDLNGINFIGNNYENLEKFYEELQNTRNRFNVESCNLFYTYPPPKDYFV